jgi:hypothetical protein
MILRTQYTYKIRLKFDIFFKIIILYANNDFETATPNKTK